MDRLITLSVGTNDDEDHVRVHQDLSELARNLTVGHDYVNVSSSLFNDLGDDEQDSDECAGEHLRYTEDTIFKVRQALAQLFTDKQVITNIITEIQNAGILFRER